MSLVVNDKNICFITAVNDELAYEECLFYIDNLYIPEGYTVEKVAMRDAKSICNAYNKACEKTNAKYKVYIHQDVFIINKSFIYDILKIFNDKKVGMIGVCGAINMPLNGIWWESKSRSGKVYENSGGKINLLDFDFGKTQQKEVECIDGLIMITQYDIWWREDFFEGWHFYDISQSREFINKGYKIITPKQQNPWCIHECGKVNINEFEKYRKVYLEKYILHSNTSKY